MPKENYELWIEGERYEIERFGLNIKKEINNFGIPEGPITSTLELSIPFTKIESEDIKAWMTSGQLEKDMDFLLYQNTELIRHYRLFGGRCTSCFEYYDNDHERMYIELLIALTDVKVESIL